MTPRHSHEPRRPRPHRSVQSSVTDLGDGERRAVALPAPALPPTDQPVHWVRVTCPECGVVRVKADRVVVRNCVDDQSWSYRARCSECDAVFLGDTPEGLALAALAAGVAVETWTLPVPSPRRPGSALSETDALEFHLALIEPDWFVAFSESDRGGDD